MTDRLSYVRPLAVLAHILASAVGAAACAQPADWVSPLGRDHSLAGRIWLPASNRYVAPEDAVARLAEARFVLLGEKHDNADHHRLQAWLVERLTASRRPAVAFEAIDRSQERALQAFLAERPKDADGIGAALGWQKSGWPAWRHYAPIVRPILADGGPLLPTVPARATLRAVLRKGIAALPPDRVQALRLEAQLPAADRKVLVRAIVEGHCNQLPAAMVGPMATVQRVKDAAMADALIRGADTEGRDMAVLIAGTGHVRRDHGVPWHVGRLAPHMPIAAVGFVEVREGDERPAAYAADFGVDRLPFDMVWFTPRVDDEDPCARFADQLRRAGERGGKKTSR